ncbi:hypothetical protein [Thermoanaerobacterium sp. R66]|uniref:hypothetical protein n=1 Tax=Thermoanaerobacterium sp. R66 TaxID=2742479 RepID=UPI0023809757|nr:hypothetical protein [Thermoanaerobacterium sp. R66]MDE4542290.1 hypothetical protein [Thermoanaerobacterium sp. R66]
MIQVLMKAVDTSDKEEMERQLTSLENSIEFRLQRIRELQELKRQAAKADVLIEKLRDEIADLNQEHKELTRLYYSQM